ncbi:Cytochrome P450 52A12 [Lecanosticta acicola]|uniref:Cytochrome P450 52A12 n=1 Tax=Lecanosticta acicola TaxID=111012 RepID=A0AAI8Z4G6_9PEZI|nr:Cytochrome P450 52A12 [Lecanosticta acicola]
MHNFILLPLIGLAVLVGYKTVAIVVTRFQNASRARQLACQPAPKSDSGFFGLKELKALQAADAKQLFPDYLIKSTQDMTKRLGRECSTFSYNVLGQTIFFTCDPKNIQAMLATQFQDFDIGATRRAILIETLGDGIFAQDGKKWEHSRAMLRPNFVREQISDLEMEERHVKNLMHVLPVRSGDGWTEFTEIQTLFFRLTIDTATDFLFGDSVLSQIAEADQTTSQPRDERAFSGNFDSAQLHMAKKFRLVDMHWLYNPKEYKANRTVINDFVNHYVDLALQKGLTSKTSPDDEKKGHYVFLEALAQQTSDPVELHAQLLNILLAGRDTTSSLLSWCFHQLLRNPHVFAKLRATILDTFGTYDDPKEVTFATLKSCHYLQYTLSETLRLWSVVPGNARRTNKPTSLPRGGGPDGLSPVFLPAGTQVDFSIHVMHRRKDLWGPDAEEFKPERFVGRRHGWEFLPFNGGPRICIGQQFALTEASYVLVRLLQRFDKIEAAPGSLEGVVRSNLTLTSCPGDKVTLRLHEASN